MEQAHVNFGNVLKAAGMDWGDVIETTVYVTQSGRNGPARAIREKFIAEGACSATFLVVQALTKPHFLFGLGGWAAKAG